MTDESPTETGPDRGKDWVAEAADALRPGTPLLQGQFLVDGFLNSGGFGITYLARDSLDRRVVLKECYPSSMCCRSQDLVRARTRSQQAEFDAVVRLFGQEARRLSKLSHPNIVGVRDVFEENGTAYMALDYVAGLDLLAVIEQQPERLGPEVLRDITDQLLDAIEHVHARDMLHRDISPDNILLRPDNTPVLIDFGAARDTARRKSRLLSALHVVKDGYSPQEFYLQSGEQSPASDLYSLAASLYHAIVGAPPVYGHIRLAAIAERKPDPYVPLTGAVAGFEPQFLTAIDTTLGVFARDRLQSASAWRSLLSQPAPTANSTVGTPSFAQDPTIVERIRRLVESTNAEVKQVQEHRAKERAERAQREAEQRLAEEEARKQRLVRARQEAEEAEVERQAREIEEAERKAFAAEEARRAERAAALRAKAAERTAGESDGGTVMVQSEVLSGLTPPEPGMTPAEHARAVRLARMGIVEPPERGNTDHEQVPSGGETIGESKDGAIYPTSAIRPKPSPKKSGMREGTPRPKATSPSEPPLGALLGRVMGSSKKKSGKNTINTKGFGT